MSGAALRVLLVDDEALALERLAQLFADIDGVDVVGTALDGREASERIAQLQPDLVMLDIQMPEKSGLKVAADLPAEHRPEIVFVTAFEHYAPDAFEVEAADYLLKPVRFDRLRQAIERAKRRALMRTALERAELSPSPAPAEAAGTEAIWVSVRDGRLRVAVDDIEWIEAAGDYVMLHTAERSHIHRASMSALEAALAPAGLVRIHRSALVRPPLVTKIQRHGRGLMSVVLKDEVTVQVGPSYARSLEARLGITDARSAAGAGQGSLAP